MGRRRQKVSSSTTPSVDLEEKEPRPPLINRSSTSSSTPSVDLEEKEPRPPLINRGFTRQLPIDEVFGAGKQDTRPLSMVDKYQMENSFSGKEPPFLKWIIEDDKKMVEWRSKTESQFFETREFVSSSVNLQDEHLSHFRPGLSNLHSQAHVVAADPGSQHPVQPKVKKVDKDNKSCCIAKQAIQAEDSHDNNFDVESKASGKATKLTRNYRKTSKTQEEVDGIEVKFETKVVDVADTKNCTSVGRRGVEKFMKKVLAPTNEELCTNFDRNEEVVDEKDSSASKEASTYTKRDAVAEKDKI